MSYGFESQISAFCDNYKFFLNVCQGTFFVIVLWKFDKIKNFFFFFFRAKDERWTTNQSEIFSSVLDKYTHNFFAKLMIKLIAF